MDVERRLVLDANILIRAVLGQRVRRIIIEHGDRAALFAPELAYREARDHLPSLLASRSPDPSAVEQALSVLDNLEGIVLAVAEETYAPGKASAQARIHRRDPNDWPVLATALVLDCPIWTEDQDFFGTGVPTWTTDRVELYLGDTD